jgi:hypothetical protein
LHTLTLHGHPIVTAGAEALAEAPALANLAELDLGHCQIGPPGAQALAASTYLTRLTRLHLGWNLLGDAGVAALVQSPTLFTNLAWLNLEGNSLTHAAGEALAACPYLRLLTRLDIHYNPLHRAGAVALARSPYLQQSVREHFERIASTT